MASSHRARPLPIWSAGGSRDRASGRGITGDLGPCRPGPTPAEPPHGSATVKIAQGKGIPEGNRRGTGTGQRPKDQTGERRTKGNQRKAEEGKEPGGQTGKPGGKPAEGNRRTCGEAPDHPVRVRGSGAARIYDAAGRSAPTAHSCPPLSGGQRPSVSRAPDAALPGASACALCGLALRWEALAADGNVFPALEADLMLTPAGEQVTLPAGGRDLPPAARLGGRRA